MTLAPFYRYVCCALIGVLTLNCSSDFPATAPYTPPSNPSDPNTPPPQFPLPPTKRLYISNDKVKLGIDLNMGGAITYLSEASSSENMINNYDLGRQLQTSLYAGPYPYSVNGKDPVYVWRNLGWNPVQTGDYFNHPARIVSYQQNQNQLYVKTVPLIWPIFDEPADCVMEHWMELKDNTVHVRSRTTVYRTDATQYEARTQEAPCINMNAPWYRLVSYVGSQPFTNGAVLENTTVDNNYRYGTENWVAILNQQGRGLGLYRANEFRFAVNDYSIPTRVGGEYAIESTYMNSSPFAVIDHNGLYEYDYTLVLGSLDDIRQFAYSQPRPATAPAYRFTQDRQGWYYYNAKDKGWPIQNELNVYWQRADTTKANFRVSSPLVFWRAGDLPKMYVRAAFTTKATVARLVWRKPEDIDFYDVPERYIDFPINGDGQVRTYELSLSGRSGWDGVINQICLLNPQNNLEKGSIMRLLSVTATPNQ
ncbi:hypothetical protein [Spirosoma oryzicola]|uniref:hypothetical protein n=1 Tax=Spirosoma oryzicola TaxID=2898794 RepID=UPI001E543346|nr:hypothetical protein [Spirosoma oryzicola]UHG90681.1 hypothetical protein LQ777_20855 [Spirosoma oryzicola]